jgi:hypothetical protein
MSAQASQSSGVTATKAQAPVNAQAFLNGVGDTPLDIVMLVDESGSETDADVARERQAAGTIAQTLLNPRSRVTVIGFGGVNGVAPNQDPTNVACQPTIASGPVNLAYLAQCVNALHRRTQAEGDDTDYAAALGQAMYYLSPNTTYGRQSPAGAVKAVLMMTDGGLDVHRDPTYLPDWLPKAHHAVDLQLAAARAASVQIWPLGFGSISPSDQQYLNYLAANGAQTACDSRQASKPHATVVSDPADALTALDDLYAAAGCLGTSKSGPEVLPGGQTRSLQVSIPAIASDGAISVDKGSPGVVVSYYTPSGTQVTGSPLGNSTFQRSGQSSAVDVLHVTNPQPGNWRIRLVAPPGLASQLVSAVAFWQGAVRAVITANPTSAQTNEPISVTLSVLGVNGPVTDPATLAEMQVAVSVSGDGLSGPAVVPVSNAGEGIRTATGVGDYNGTFKAPDRQGTLTFIGTAAGYGLHATEIPTTVQVGGVAGLLQAAVQFTASATVQPGQTVQGQVFFANKTGQTRTVRLSLTAAPDVAEITSPTDTMQVPAGTAQNPTPISITFHRNAPKGAVFLKVIVVDAANSDISYGNGVLNITVVPPPGFVAKYFWELVALAILTLIAIFLILRRRHVRRARADVRGLYAILRRDAEQMGPELKAPARWADTFRFVIRDEAESNARLAHPRPDDRVYAAARGTNGTVKVVTPEGEKYDIAVGGLGEPLPNGLQLVFRDMRYIGQGIRLGQAGGLSGTNGLTSTDGLNGTSEPKPAPASRPSPKPDEWL